MHNRRGEDLGGEYRYGFNGMEKDDEVKGAANSLDFGARIYDPRVGRFLSIDPQFSQFPHQTPYLFAGNKPIMAIDRNGEDEFYVITFTVYNEDGNEGVMNAKIIRVPRPGPDVFYRAKGDGQLREDGYTRADYSRMLSGIYQARKSGGNGVTAAQYTYFRQMGGSQVFRELRIYADHLKDKNIQGQVASFGVWTNAKAYYGSDEDASSAENFDEASLERVNRVIERLTKSPSLRVQLIGFGSDLGGEEYVQSLSERRVEQMKEYLLSRLPEDFDADRILTLGKGIYEPGGDPDEDNPEHRVVVIKNIHTDADIEE